MKVLANYDCSCKTNFLGERPISTKRFEIKIENQKKKSKKWLKWKSFAEDKTCARKMRTTQLAVALLTLVLVSGLKTAAEYQVSPPKTTYNLRKRKKQVLEEIPSNVSHVYAKKRGRRLKLPSGDVHHSRNER